MFTEITRWADQLGIYSVTWNGEQWGTAGYNTLAEKPENPCPLRIQMSKCGENDTGEDLCESKEKEAPSKRKPCAAPQNIGMINYFH